MLRDGRPRASLSISYPSSEAETFSYSFVRWPRGATPAFEYPSLITTVSDAVRAKWRTRSLSVCRFWRSRSAPEAQCLLEGAVAVLTFLSGAVVAAVMREARKGHDGVSVGAQD